MPPEGQIKDVISFRLSRETQPDSRQCTDEDKVVTPPKVKWLYQAHVQTVIFIIVALCTVGPYNGLNALGGGGLSDHLLATKVNCVYAFSLAVFGWIGGAVFNYLGARMVVCLASLCYTSYVGVLLAVTLLGASPNLVYPCGVLLGLGGALMWASFGAISIRYAPLEHQSKNFALMWGSMNTGGFLCGCLAFASNVTSTSHEVSLLSYGILGTSVLLGTLMSATLLRHQQNVVRSDNAKVDTPAAPGLLTIMREASAVFKDKRLYKLWPIFMVPFAHMPFLFNGMNAQFFNIRTRSLNSSLYWGARIPGGFIFYLLTRNVPQSRSRRGGSESGARSTEEVMASSQRQYLDGHEARSSPSTVVEIKRVVMRQLYPGLNLSFIWAIVCLSIGCMALFGAFGVNLGTDILDVVYDFPLSGLLMCMFLFFGMLDAFVQSFVYNILAALTGEDTKSAAVYSGFYKSLQSLSVGVFWFVDWMMTTYGENSLGIVQRYKIHWLVICALWVASFPGALYTLWLGQKELNENSESQTLPLRMKSQELVRNKIGPNEIILR